MHEDPKRPDVELQRDYYKRTAQSYESMHSNEREHDVACALIHALCEYHGFSSILDVGSGTGRGLRNLTKSLPNARVLGVEPVEALRAIGHANGIPEKQLIDGDATRLGFPDSSFDLVCELSVLHHIPNPRLALAEMIRVANRGIFLSDVNRFGQGPLPGRYAKLFLWKLGLWPVADWIKNKGKRYINSEGDGVHYSYSIFDDYEYICSQCDNVMVFNFDGSGRNALTGASHVGLFGMKKHALGP